MTAKPKRIRWDCPTGDHPGDSIVRYATALTAAADRGPS